jgi:hypothetical protein
LRKSSQASIRRVGGVSHAQFGREGMRRESLAYARKPYAGKSPKEATKIATTLVKPVVVGVHAGGRVELIDGRHRLQAAKEAGATHIAADVIVYGPRGGVVKKYRAKVKL